MRLRTRIILGIACVIGALMMLYPPWFNDTRKVQALYAFITSRQGDYGHSIYGTMLVVQLLGLAFATGAVLLATMGRRRVD